VYGISDCQNMAQISLNISWASLDSAHISLFMVRWKQWEQEYEFSLKSAVSNMQKSHIAF